MQLETAPEVEDVACGQEPAVRVEKDVGRHGALDLAIEPMGRDDDGARKVLRQGKCVDEHSASPCNGPCSLHRAVPVGGRERLPGGDRPPRSQAANVLLAATGEMKL